MSIKHRQEDGVVELFKGAVLATREKNYYDDSDFYAIVWDDEKGACYQYIYASTRFASADHADVDATPETLAKVREAYVPILVNILKEDYEKQRNTPEKGDKVIYTGRKTKHAEKGAVGVVFWSGVYFDKWHYKRTERRYGFRDESGKAHWASAHNLKVIECDRTVPDEQTLIEEARKALSDDKIPFTIAFLLNRGSGLYFL